jgi:hypothetical protein
MGQKGSITKVITKEFPGAQPAVPVIARRRGSVHALAGIRRRQMNAPKYGEVKVKICVQEVQKKI